MGSRIGMGKKQSKVVISEKPQDLRNTRYTTVWPQIKGAGFGVSFSTTIHDYIAFGFGTGELTNSQALSALGGGLQCPPLKATGVSH